MSVTWQLLNIVKCSSSGGGITKSSHYGLKTVQRLQNHHHHQQTRCRTGTSQQQQTSDPMPYVGKPYSYSYGRSNRELIYTTLGRMLDARVAAETGKPMVVFEHEAIGKTFTEFQEDVNRVAKAMYEELGLARGDVAGLWGCNSYNWLTIQYACARLGVILCTINPYYQAGELTYALHKGDVKVLFMPGKASVQEGINKFGKILAETFSKTSEPFLLNHIVSMDGGVYEAGDIPPTESKVQFHTLEKLKNGRNADLNSRLTSLVAPEDPALIMFTSGTTGEPKGACLSQFGLLNNAILNMNHFHPPPNGDIAFCVPLPFFHLFAAALGCISMVAKPFKLVVPFMKYNVTELVAALNKHSASHLTATPTLVIDLMNYIKKSGVKVPTLNCVISGGASMPVEIARQFVQTVPSVSDFRIGYGATELSPVSTLVKSWHSFERRVETIGTPHDFIELKIVNPETKQVVKLGETGEIHSRGYNTMLGYWKDAQRTAEAIDRSGWYNTGDLGTMDEEGFLKIVGRTKEMIIVGGENVYPREVEELLHRYPDILDAYVIGVPDPRKGEEVCAWIKLADNCKVTEEEIKKFCTENLAYFKVPKYYLFVDQFPVTSVGKAKKFVMREMTCEKLGLQEKK